MATRRRTLYTHTTPDVDVRPLDLVAFGAVQRSRADVQRVTGQPLVLGAASGGRTSITATANPQPVWREVRIYDADGNELPTGTAGRVYMRIRQPFHYHNDPEKTDANRIGDFATVGDVGYLDEDGYLFLCDRDSNVIIAGGVNIYPAEAENVLAAYPEVGDVAVIGVPHEEMGEDVKGVVVPVPGVEPTDDLADELIATVSRRSPSTTARARSTPSMGCLAKTTASSTSRRSVSATGLAPSRAI